MANKFDLFEQKIKKSTPSNGGSSFSNFEQQIRQTGTQTPTPKKTIGGFVSNVFSSGGKAIEGIGSAISDPIGTIKGAGKIIAGGIQSIPGVAELYPKGRENPLIQENQQAFKALVDLPGQRYGTGEKALNTLYNDPVGAALDAATILSGAGGALSKAGTVSRAGKVAEVGKALSTAGEVINPITQGLKLSGKGLSALTKGRQIGGGKFTSDVIPSAENIGIPREKLPISTMTKSPVSAGAEAWAAKGIGGGKIMDEIENVYTKMNDKIDDVLKGSSSPSDLGKRLSVAVDDFKKNFFEQKQKLYNEASIPLTKAGVSPLFNGTKVGDAIDSLTKKIADGEKQGIADGFAKSQIEEAYPKIAEWKKTLEGLKGSLMTADTPKTRSLLSTLISKEKEALKGLGKPSSPELKTYESMLKGLSRKDITTRGLNSTLQKIEGDIKTGTLLKTGNNAKLSLIQSTLDEEFLAILKKQRPDLASSLARADDFMKQGIQKINSGVIQAIKANVNDPDLIVSSLLPKIESLEDVNTLIQVVGEKNMVGIRQSLLSDIFEKSKSAGNTNLQPAGISRQIKRGGDDKLQLLLEPEQYQTLKDLEKISLSMKTGQALLGGSQTAFLTRTGLTGTVLGTALGGLLSGNVAVFAGALTAVLGEIAYNKLVSSPLGKKLLTEGVRLSGKTGRTIQQLAPSAGKAALFGQQYKNYQENNNSLFGR